MAHRQEQTSGGAGFISPGNVPSSFYVDSLKAILTIARETTKAALVSWKWHIWLVEPQVIFPSFLAKQDLIHIVGSS